MNAPLLALTVLAGLTACAAATGPIDRYTLTIEGISEQPRPFEISGLEMSLPVVEVENGTPLLSKVPGTPNAGAMTFSLPEIEDEVLVAFRSWFLRIANDSSSPRTGEPHHADLVAYDRLGNAIRRWRLHNSWPSRIAGPNLKVEDDGVVRTVRTAITLQIDETTPIATEGTAPWPDLLSTRVDRRSGTFRMSWRSVAGASYNVYRIDGTTNRVVLVEENLVAGGDVHTISRLLEDEGIYYVVLTSPPPPPERR